MNGLIFYFGIALLLAYLASSWWVIILILGASHLLLIWQRWQRVNSNLTPEQSLGGLIALLRIRSAEIGTMYHTIRTFQKEAKDDSWIPLFIADFRSTSSFDVYQESCDKKEKKYRDKAFALFAKRFSYNPFNGLLNDNALADIGVAMLFWSSGFQNTIKLLKSIPCDTNLSQHVCALLREYQLISLLTLNGNYHILFKNWRPLSSLLRERYRLLLQHWEEVWHSHQNSILITQAASQIKEASLDAAWSEGQALADMERNLRRALSKKNTKSFDWGGKDEQVFFQYLKSNPLWLKFYKNLCDIPYCCDIPNFYESDLDGRGNTAN